jgi:hypothetical protein
VSAAPDPPTRARARDTGCLRITLFGCAALALAGVAGLVMLRIYMRVHPAAARVMAVSMMEQNEDQMRRQFGSDVTEEDRRLFDQASARFNRELQRKPEILRDASLWKGRLVVRRGELLHHQDVLRLVGDFQAIAAGPEGGPR